MPATLINPCNVRISVFFLSKYKKNYQLSWFQWRNNCEQNNFFSYFLCGASNRSKRDYKSY